MTMRPWIFLINTFYVNTVESIKKALTLTLDHLAKLTANEADAEILAIKTAYLPLHDAFILAYNQLQSKLGLYHGKTQTFEEMLEELSKTKINEWRGTVFNIFPEGTANATAIFPQDREPFQKGTYDQRVEAVHTLSTTLATYTTQASLVALSAVVMAYYLTLTGARALQQTDEGSVETLRSNLKAAHKIMCDGLYRNLGKLMAKYAETPLVVANYYDLTLLREVGDESQVFNGSITANTIISLTETEGEDFDATPETVFRMKNPSTNSGNLTFYSANSPTDAPGAGPQFTLTPGQTLDKTLLELGLGTMPFFNIQNPSAFDGTWEVEVL
jgi:hypothetical protein